jgi:hypothetical protein
MGTQTDVGLEGDGQSFFTTRVCVCVNVCEC